MCECVWGGGGWCDIAVAVAVAVPLLMCYQLLQERREGGDPLSLLVRGIETDMSFSKDWELYAKFDGSHSILLFLFSLKPQPRPLRSSIG